VAVEVHGVLEDYDRVRSDVRLMGIPSGYKSLDDIILGWSPGDLVVIGASQYGQNIPGIEFIRNAAMQQYKRGIITLKMTNRQLANRLIAIEENIDSF